MAVTNVAELNALVERVKKPSKRSPVFLNNKSMLFSAQPHWPLLMPVFP